jgi:adenylosuccinate lyase
MMKANLDKLGGLVHSQRVMLALVEKGMSREEAYATVQRHAMTAWEGHGYFQDLLKKEPQVAKLIPETELAELFDLGYHLKHVDTLFRRVFGENAP